MLEIMIKIRIFYHNNLVMYIFSIFLYMINILCIKTCIFCTYILNKEIIFLSKKYFLFNETNYKSNFIEHLYNLKDFYNNSNIISYYHIKKGICEKIIIENGKFYKFSNNKKELIESRMAKYKEIKLLQK